MINFQNAFVFGFSELIVPPLAASFCLCGGSPFSTFNLFLVWILIFPVIRKTFNVVYDTFLGRLIWGNVDLKSVGEWAVITGATDGIGLEYSRAFAKMGINVALISRTEEKLSNLCDQIQEDFGVKTAYLTVDFSQPPEEYAKKLESFLNSMDVGILINNVGMSYKYPATFDAVSPEFITSMVNINVYAVTIMTHSILPQMLQKNKGVIVNVGSFASIMGLPYFSLYSASKCYMEKLTMDLSLEFKETGLIFQYQSPGYVTTKMSKFDVKSFLTPSPEEYVKAAIPTIGFQTNSCIWVWHRLTTIFFNFLLFFHFSLAIDCTHFFCRTIWISAARKRMLREQQRSKNE